SCKPDASPVSGAAVARLAGGCPKPYASAVSVYCTEPMSRICLSLLVSALCAAVACSSESESQRPPSADAAIAQADAAAPTQAAGANACLLEYQSRYDALLTLDRAASAAQLPPDKAEVSYQKVLKNPQYHEVS